MNELEEDELIEKLAGIIKGIKVKRERLLKEKEEKEAEQELIKESIIEEQAIEEADNALAAKVTSS